MNLLISFIFWTRKNGENTPKKPLLFIKTHSIKCSDSQATESYLLESVITKPEWTVIQLTIIQYIPHNKNCNLKTGAYISKTNLNQVKLLQTTEKTTMTDSLLNAQY